jgi:hypothetical protein
MPLLPAVLGINLWLLTLAVPLAIVLVGPRPAPLYLLLLPLSPALLILGLRLTTRRSGHPLAGPALLLGVPLASFLPVADGPLADAALHPRPQLVLLIAALLAYLLAASRTLAAPAGASTAEVALTPLQRGPVPRRWRRRMLVYRSLWVFSIAAPLLFLFQLDLRPATLRALHLSFGSPERVGAVQAAATAAFALLWIFTFHFCLGGPLYGHLEQDREVTARIAALRLTARRGRPRPQFYVAMLLALCSMLLLIYLSYWLNWPGWLRSWSLHP